MAPKITNFNFATHKENLSDHLGFHYGIENVQQCHPMGSWMPERGEGLPEVTSGHRLGPGLLSLQHDSVQAERERRWETGAV
jgi:hypothetical protein